MQMRRGRESNIWQGRGDGRSRNLFAGDLCSIGGGGAGGGQDQ